jgi:phage pi2 protein 07
MLYENETTNPTITTNKLLIVKSGYHTEEIRYKPSEFYRMVKYLQALLNSTIKATIVIIDLEEPDCEKKYNLENGKLVFVDFSYQYCQL